MLIAKDKVDVNAGDTDDNIDYAGWADKIEGESFTADDGTYKIVRHEPLGVCAGIAPWNAPLLYVGWKIAPALAAGNTVSPLKFCHLYYKNH